MKKLVVLLVFTFVTSAAAYTFSPTVGDDPEFKVVTNKCSDGCFDVDYSYPGEGRKPVSCTVKVEVRYSENGNKGGKTETFEMTRTVGSSGSGWGYFDGKSALDKIPLLSASITSSSCS